MREFKVISSVVLFALLTTSACVDTFDEDLAAMGAEDRAVVNEEVLSQSVEAAATCQLHLGPTSRSGNTITGYGSQESCGTQGRSTLTIQRSRWFGWEDLVSSTVTGSGHDVFVRYNCSGTGTHEFRTIHTGRTISGSPNFKESNHITVTCN